MTFVFQRSRHFYPDSIMWHASTGDRTFTGPFGVMLAHGITRMIDEMNELHEIDEEYELGLRAFDTQTREQKAWSLHKVAFGLLNEMTPMPELTAYMEATAAAIFYQLDACVQIEQDDGGFFWRKLVLAAYESIGGNDPADLEGDEKLLTPECDDTDKWQFVLGTLEEQVFWDMDYTNDRMIDMAPELVDEVRSMFGVSPDGCPALMSTSPLYTPSDPLEVASSGRRRPQKGVTIPDTIAITPGNIRDHINKRADI